MLQNETQSTPSDSQSNSNGTAGRPFIFSDIRQQAKLLRPKPQPKFSPLQTAAEFCAEKRAPVEFLVRPWITNHSLTMLHGFRGCGKTRFMLNAASAMASGTDFLGWEVRRPLKVLYVDGELPANLFENWLQEHPSLDFQVFNVDDRLQKDEELDLKTDEGRSAFAAQLLDVEAPEVVIYDSAFTLLGIGSLEQEAGSMGAFMQWLWRRRHKESSIILHHDNRAGEAWGYITKETLLDTVFQITKTSGDEENLTVKLEPKKHRRFWGEDAALRTLSMKTVGGKVNWNLEAVETKKQAIVRLKKEGMAQTKIAKELGVSEPYVSRVIKEELL